MSSTNRSDARKEHIADYYCTPISDIELFLNEFKKIDGVQDTFQNGIIVDCCAGGNSEIKDENGVKEVYHPMSYPVALNNVFGDKLDIRTYDIRKDSFADNKVNYLDIKLKYRPNVIITNPPFRTASEIIKKSLDDVVDGGYVIMLLRLNYFGSKDRKPFFDEFMPEYAFVHHQRIGFTEKKNDNGYVLFNKDGKPKNGSTDSIEYMHAVWRKGYKPEYTKLFVI